MSVDKAKDTPPKKPITENKIVDAKPESPTKTENKPDVTSKKQGMGEGQKVRSRYPKPTRTTGTTFLERRKSDSAAVYCRGPIQPWQFCDSPGLLGRLPERF
jgi:hypothetical protein